MSPMLQSVLIGKRGEPDTYCQYVYNKQYITCRLQMVQKVYRNREGKESMSKGIIYSITKLDLDDKVYHQSREYVVDGVQEVVDLVGKFQYYKCILI
jgi:hypothetical protein